MDCICFHVTNSPNYNADTNTNTLRTNEMQF